MLRRRVISMRVIVTAVAAVMITGTVIAVGSVAERNTRNALTKELQTRLAVEGRNIAILSSAALLSDYPELTLHPMIKDIQRDRPDLSLVYILDHNGIVKGHADIDELGKKIERTPGLEVVPPMTQLSDGEVLLGNAEMLVLETLIRRANGQEIGKAVVGMGRTHIDAVLTEARKQQLAFLVPILIVGVVATLLLMSRLLGPVSALRDGLEKIGAGDLSFRLDESARTELGLLASSINEMAGELKAAQGELVEKERLDHEMQLAREIQQSLLPSVSIDSDKYIISGSQTAAEEVGGDYYDYFPLDETHIGVVVADVAGKGLAGCLVMSMIAALIRALCGSHSSPSKLLVEVERSLQGSLRPGTFVTMFYGILNTRTGRITYASAGHNPVIHYKAKTSKVEWTETEGVPIGLVEGALAGSLKDHKLQLAPGDVLVQFTDGYSEAPNADGQEFGIERMAERVAQSVSSGCTALLVDLQLAVDNWEANSNAGTDDKTLLVIERSAGKVAAGSTKSPARDSKTRVETLWARRKESDLHLTVPATLEALDGLGRWLKSLDGIRALSDEQLGLLELGLYEVCANIAEHGCGLDPDKTVDIWWIPEGHGADGDGVAESEDSGACVSRGYFLTRDYGTPPDLSKWSIPDMRSGVAARGRGLGLRMIHTIMHDLEVHAGTGHGNVTVMRFDVSNISESEDAQNHQEVPQDA